MQDSLLQIRKTYIFDNGPLYHEFHPQEWIKEPWNAYSSLVFFIPVIYWLWRLRGEYKEHLFLLFMLPLLFLNGLGSTLFHAFRASDFFLVLDYLPASILTATVAVYFWTKVLKKWYFGLLAVIVFQVINYLVTNYLILYKGGQMNVSYFMVGVSFFTPLFIILIKTNFYKWYYILFALISLVGALIFRILDYPNPNPFPHFLPQGTHFLWHIVSSFAVIFFRILYLLLKQSKYLE